MTDSTDDEFQRHVAQAKKFAATFGKKLRAAKAAKSVMKAKVLQDSAAWHLKRYEKIIEKIEHSCRSGKHMSACRRFSDSHERMLAKFIRISKTLY